MRSMPPPWMSKTFFSGSSHLSPPPNGSSSLAIDMAEHSMCQPGRPSPRCRPATASRARRPSTASTARNPSRRACRRRRRRGRRPASRRASGARARRSAAPWRAVHLRRREQHLAFRDIGVAARDQPLDHGAHLGDVFGGARLDGRLQAAERLHVRLELRVGLLGDLADRLVERQAGIVARGARVDLVVDVGDVADIGDVVGAIEMAQQPEQHVEDDDRPRIADMGEVVDRRAADIHAHVGGSIGTKSSFVRVSVL